MKEVKKLKQDYQDYFKKMEDFFSEREYETNQIKLAILIKEHVLLKGLPGTAKTLLSQKILKGFTGATVFEQQFTRFMDDQYIMGPQSIEEFKKGNIVHNIEGSLLTTDFARLDEFFNASEELLVSANEILNERSSTRQSRTIPAKLLTAIMTTNQEREEEKELRAVYDRILFTSEVADLVKQESRIKMFSNFLRGISDEEYPKFAFHDLKILHEEFEKYKPQFSDMLLIMFDAILDEYTQQTSIGISPRKKNKMLLVAKADAFLKGQETIEVENLKSIKYALVNGGDIKNSDKFDAVFDKSEKSMAMGMELMKFEKALHTKILKYDDKLERTRMLAALASHIKDKISEWTQANCQKSVLEKAKDLKKLIEDKVSQSGLSEDEIFPMDDKK